MQIALIGDYSVEVIAHRAIPDALQLEANHRRIDLTADWLSTETLNEPAILANYDAGWVVPASPYIDFENALSAIRYLRENNKPFLGTCGGYQHALIEFAKNVLNLKQAGITEIEPTTEMPLVSSLMCALIETSEVVIPEPGGLIAKLVGTATLQETYHCSFGLNPEFSNIFDSSTLCVDARDEIGAVRAMALTNHPFFLGTAFQPERAALKGKRHPIISGFVGAALAAANSVCT